MTGKANAKTLLYSTSLETWEVWQMGRPIAHGTLANCQRAYPDLQPGYSQLVLAGLVVEAEVDACSIRPDGHAPHLRSHLTPRDDGKPWDPPWLFCLGAYDQERQLLRVKVRFDTETLLAVGGKPWEHDHPFTFLETA